MADNLRRGLKRRQITIKEVAERAGVSQMTVSRVLNRRDIVKESTRERVHKAIEELNYKPNLLARGLAGGKSLFIGLIYSNPSSSYLSELLVGAMTKCRAEGHYLILEDYKGGDNPDDFADLIDRVKAAGLSGLIIGPPLSENRELINLFPKEDMPTVLITPRETFEGELSVYIDDEDAAQSMVKHLYAAGHSSIGFIKGPERYASARRRYRGYQAALKTLGLTFREDWVDEGDYTYRSGMMAADRILSRQERPTAIFASNDDMAGGAIAAALCLGLHVPEDVSIAGFDDSSIARGIWPQLTTVHQPISEMAGRAVELLTQYFNKEPGDPFIHSIRLEHSIVERDSVLPSES